MTTAHTQSHQGPLDRNHFLLRRLHSLTGVIPIGVFLLFHLTTNASVVWGMLDSREGEALRERGVRTFQNEVDFIHSTPFLFLVEIFGLWLPIAFHSILGLYYAKTGKGNAASYGWAANRRYSLQRLSGYVGVLFLFYHVATLRWHWTFLMPGGVAWDGERAASTLALVLRGASESALEAGASYTLGGVIVSLFYMLGVSLLVYHFANGLWTAAITWGLTISQRAQQRWGVVCAGLGVALMALAWSSLIGFMTLDPKDAAAIERSHSGHKGPAMQLGDSQH